VAADAVRQILIKLLGEETVDKAARKAARGLGAMGDAADDAERDTRGLNKALEETHQTLTRLKDQARRSDDPLSFMKDINRQQRNLNNLKKLFADAGDDGASGFGARFVARLGPVLAHAPISPPLIAAVGAATPAIAATLSAGVLAGLAGGTVAVGVRAAFNDPTVKAEGENFGKFLSQTLAESTQSFVPATLGGMSIVRKEIRSLGPELKRAGDIGASYVAPITRGFTSLAREALPGVTEALADAGPVVRQLETGLGRVGKAAGDAMADIGEGSQGAALALGDLLTISALGVREVGRSVSGLTKTYQFMRAATAINKKDFAVTMADNAASSAAFEKELQDLVKNLGDTRTAAGLTSQAIDAVNQAMEEAPSAALSAEEANLRMQQSYADLTGVLDENGKVTNTNSQKYRDNMTALLDYAGSVQESSAATMEATGSQTAANAVLDDGRTKFLAAAAAAGVEAKKATELANKLFGIPGQRKTDIKVNKAAAEAALRAFNEAANRAARDREMRIRVNYSLPSQSGALGAVGQLGMRAAGGPVLPGRNYLVGEKGPELLSMGSQGGYVTPNHRLGGGGGGDMAGAVGRAVGRAMTNMNVVLDGRVVGRIEGRRADLLERGG
jgi:hypothetical protein